MARAEQRASLPYTNTRVPHQRPEHRPLKLLHNRTFRCGGHSAAFCPLSFTFWMTPDSWDWTWIWPICHAWLDWSVCVRSRRCVCVHAVEAVEFSKSRWFWILPSYSSDHVHPWGDPCVHGKVNNSVSDGHSQGLYGCVWEQQHLPDLGRPLCHTLQTKISHPCRNSVLLSATARISLLRLWCPSTHDSTLKKRNQTLMTIPNRSIL